MAVSFQQFLGPQPVEARILYIHHSPEGSPTPEGIVQDPSDWRGWPGLSL